MAKKCIICDGEAKFRIKGLSDFYCEECANSQFSDITLLQSLEEDAQALKKFIDEKEEFDSGDL